MADGGLINHEIYIYDMSHNSFLYYNNMYYNIYSIYYNTYTTADGGLIYRWRVDIQMEG